MATATTRAPAARAQAMSSGVSPTTTACDGRASTTPRSRRLGHGRTRQRVAFRVVVAEDAPPEAVPQAEVLELDAGAGRVVAGQERRRHLRTGVERVEQRRHARHRPLGAVSRLVNAPRSGG